LNLASFIFSFVVRDHPTFDQPLRRLARHSQQWVRLRPSLHGARLVPVWPVAHAFLADQLQEPGKIHRDPRRIVEMNRLERADRVLRSREAELPWLHLRRTRRLRHHPPDQVVRQQVHGHLLGHHLRGLGPQHLHLHLRLQRA